VRSSCPLTLVCAVLACAGTPGYVLRWKYGFYPTTLLEHLVVLTLVVFAVETLITRTRPDWRTPFSIAALLFVVAGAISVVVAPDRRAALGIYRAYLLEPIAFFLVLASVVRTFERGLAILGGLAAAGLIVAVANLAAVGHALATGPLDLAVNTPVAIYTTSNAVALFLVPMLAVAGSLVLYATDRRVRLAALSFTVVAGSATILSFSRGGYVALAAVALLLALTHRRRVLLVAIALVGGGALASLPAIRARIAHELDFADPFNSLTGRFPLWRSTLRMLRDHPLFGAGLSAFDQTIRRYRGVETAGTGLIYPHNLLLNFWSETGLLGLLAFAWILVQGFRVNWRGWRGGAAPWRPIHLGVLLALVAILVHGLVDVPYWKNDLSLEFWALLGLSAAGIRDVISAVPAHHVDHQVREAV